MAIKCGNQVGEVDSSVQCYLCSSWFHIKCVSINKNFYKDLKKYGGNFEFFCESCNAQKEEVIKFVKDMIFKSCLNKGFSNNNEKISEIKEDLNFVKSNLLKKPNDVIEAVTEVKNEISNLKDIMPENKPKPFSLPQVIKKKKEAIKNDTEKSNLEASSAKAQTENYCLFAKGISAEGFKNQLSFKQCISEKFPGVKIIKCFRKSNGIVNMYFNNKDDVEMMEKKWSDKFSGSSVISLKNLKLKENSNNELILRDAALNITDSHILLELQATYPSVDKVERFRKNGKEMPIVKVILKSEEECKKLLCNGFVLNNLFMPAEKIIQLKRPVRCFNCFRLGHQSSVCNSKKLCKNCSNEFHNEACVNVPKCINCSGPHSSSDTKCPHYEKLMQKLNSQD